MRVNEYLCLVGSGQFGLSNRMDCHVYLLHRGSDAVLIDAGVGVEPERILENIAADLPPTATVRAILLTHSHSDHAGGAQALSKAFGCPVYASPAEGAIVRAGTDHELGLDRARPSGVYPMDYEFAHCEAQDVGDGETVEFGELALRAVVVPSHSLGSTAWVYDGPGGIDLFSGDIVFAKGAIGLLNCYGSSLEAYRENFGKLATLGINGFYPGHFVFCLENGQQHLDLAAEELKALYVPKCF